ncbi:MAG: cupin domain-containing protein [Candidatus Bathyarchaeia archaeon]
MRPSQIFVRLRFSDIANKGWVVGSQQPKGSDRYSERIQIGFNQSDEPWVDDAPHLHTDSEEWYIVLRGSLKIRVGGQVVSVGPREVLGVKANTPHRIIGGEGPIEEFSVRTPSIQDKVGLG